MVKYERGDGNMKNLDESIIALEETQKRILTEDEKRLFRYAFTQGEQFGKDKLYDQIYNPNTQY
jgi:hypothetical protein